MITTDDIKSRRDEVHQILITKMREAGGYTDLSVQEKIPLRIMAAEILSLESLVKTLSIKNLDQAITDLENTIQECVTKERYCGAEGLKRVKDWLIKKGTASSSFFPDNF